MDRLLVATRRQLSRPGGEQVAIVVLTLLAIYEASRFESNGGPLGRSRAIVLSLLTLVPVVLCRSRPALAAAAATLSPSRSCERRILPLTVVSIVHHPVPVGAPGGPPWSPRRRSAAHPLLRPRRRSASRPRTTRSEAPLRCSSASPRSPSASRCADANWRSRRSMPPKRRWPRASVRRRDGGTRAHRPGAPRHRRSSPVRDRRRERGCATDLAGSSGGRRRTARVDRRHGARGAHRDAPASGSPA